MKTLPKYNWAAIALIVTWAIFLGIVGPALISLASDVAVIAGLTAGFALLLYTYHWLAKTIKTKDL